MKKKRNQTDILLHFENNCKIKHFSLSVQKFENTARSRGLETSQASNSTWSISAAFNGLLRKLLTLLLKWRSLLEWSKAFRIREKFCLKLCQLNYLWWYINKTTSVSGNTLKNILRALNSQSCKKPFFDLLRHQKFQKLTSSLLVIHCMQQEIICVPKFCDI